MVKKTIVILLIIIFAATPVLADSPFQGYVYNFWGDLVPSPAAYSPIRTISARDISPELDEFNDPTDIHVDSNENVYIVDSGNNRVIVFDMELNLNRVIDGFYRDGIRETFNRPNGIFVTDHMEIFIADTRNNRVVILDENDNFIREITSPQIEGLADDFVFLPLNVLVDRGGRTYVIVQLVFEGIMSFNPEGDFIGYFGTVSVSFNPIELIWRFFMTDEQRARQIQFIPTEFRSMDIDEYGFIFTTHMESWHANNQVMRLNPRGEDVLVNFNENVPINGDQGFRPSGTLSGPSVFIDVIARSHGRYSALDSTRGRVYTYDSEGNLLYVFAGTGNMQGMARRPVSIDAIGEDILMLDAHGAGRVIHFAPTVYGQFINAAIINRYDGNESEAVEAWRQLVTMDENFALAWSGIGRSYLSKGENATAMYYLRRGMDIRHFSVAFRRNRLEVMQVVLPNVLTGASVLAFIFVIYKIVRKFTGKGRGAVAE